MYNAYHDKTRYGAGPNASPGASPNIVRARVRAKAVGTSAFDPALMVVGAVGLLVVALASLQSF